MQVTLKQLVNGWEALSKLGQVSAGEGLKIKQAYWVGKIIAAVEPELQRFDKLRMALAESMGETIDGQLKIKPENVKAFTEQVEALLGETIELPGQTLPLNELASDLPLSGIDLLRLNWLITES
jgi:hypothetical protein